MTGWYDADLDGAVSTDDKEEFLRDSIKTWLDRTGLNMTGWFDTDLDGAVSTDDKEEFLRVIDSKLKLYCTRPQEILLRVVSKAKLRCAEALINGETPLSVHLNLPCTDYGAFPIHVVTLGLATPAITELILYYGARTDIPFRPSKSVYRQKKFTSMLPLQIVLQRITVNKYVKDWTPKDSIYKLVTLFCLPILQDELETIALLAGTTKETAEVFLEYAMQGKIIEVAALLMVTHKKVYEVMDRVQQHYDYIETNHMDEDQREKIKSIRHLIEVFDRTGDAISAYVKQDKFYVNKHQTIADVSCMLVGAGFHLQHSDVDLSDDAGYHFYDREDSRYRAYHTHGWDVKYNVNRCLDDFGMAHYSKSGYRWKASNEDPWWIYKNLEGYMNKLKKDVEGLKKENDNIKKQERQPNLRIWMDDELGNALEKDDKEEFLSVIDRKVDFFRSRQQQLLYLICASGSIKCAEALLKGETPLTVDLNLPCTDTGMYPLHCSALSFFPSITELFLYYGARTDIQFTPSNPSDIFPQHLLESHTNKLPLHMALLGITRFPCISEWTPEDSIYKLLVLLCLPRMQNPLETLGLLAGTTDYIEDEFSQLVTDGKIVEIAALLMVANEELYDVMQHTDNDIAYWFHDLVCVFQSVGNKIAAYIKEDKYNVTKYQAIEDVNSILKETEMPSRLSPTDLTIYKWYRDEECSYPSQAPFEDVRILHDVGMAHYAKSGFRWKVSKKDMCSCWRSERTKAYISEMENELKCLKEENALAIKRQEQALKPASFGVPYIIHQGVPIASSRFFCDDDLKTKIDSPDGLNTKVDTKTDGALVNLQTLGSTRAIKSSPNMLNLPTKRAMSSMAVLLTRVMKHI